MTREVTERKEGIWQLSEGGCLTSEASEKPNLIACALTEILIQAQQRQQELVSVTQAFLTRTDLTEPTNQNPKGILHSCIRKARAAAVERLMPAKQWKMM